MKLTRLTDVGLNVETHAVDLRCHVNSRIAGRETNGRDHLAKIHPHMQAGRAIDEANDEVAYWLGGPKIPDEHADLVLAVRKLMQEKSEPRVFTKRDDGQVTVINAVCVHVATGIVSVRFGFVEIEDGYEVARTWHRTTIPPGIEVGFMLAAINKSITTSPELLAAPVEASSVPLLQSVCQLVHTPDVVKHFADGAGSRAEDRRETK